MGSSEGADITNELRNAPAFLAAQNRVLELIAGDEPLSAILDTIARMLEAQAPGLTCSILLVEDGRLRHGAAPSLPEPYVRAIDGGAIGPCVGSCGTAAFTGQRVIVDDIATDPLWAGYRDIALSHGLRACWSTPILSKQGAVLATFAVYYLSKSSPSQADLHLVEVATHITRIAIERRRADEALRAQAVRLQDLDRRKDEFLALLAHELRNPLAPIVAAVELMRLRADDRVRVERYRTIIDRQARHLSRLVNELLDVSRIMRGKIDLVKERTSAAALIARAAETAGPLIEARQHQLSIELPREALELHADPIRLTQAISNLLNNAAKFTEPGGRITVSAAREGAAIVIRVKDTGRGVPAELLPQIFELFVQADTSLGRSMGGLGVGLTLARSLIGLHGGLISAHSAGLDRGTEVVIRLPSGDLGAHAAASASPLTPREKGAGRVLVVDDNVDAAEGLAELILSLGHQVRVAHEGESGLAESAAWSPRIVFLDIGLPGIDGYEVARRMRSADPDHAVRLIALTGYGRESDVRRSREAGFDVHLVKPVDLAQIKAALGE